MEVCERMWSVATVGCWWMGRVEMGVGWKFGNDDMEVCWRLRSVGINSGLLKGGG
jgi:hypothetical protein